MLHEFSYVIPREKKEILTLLKNLKGKARVLAGGTDLMVDIRAGKEKPEIIVDVKGIEDFQGVAFDAKGSLAIGSTTTCRQLMQNKILRQKFPIIVDAAGRIGSPQLRNRATIGGNICTASPCADLGTALLALNAEVEVASIDGVRTLPLREFYIGVKKTQLREFEIVQRIIIPNNMAGAKYGMEKLKRIKGHDLALASVVMIKTESVLRVAIGSCAPTPIALKEFPADVQLKMICEEARKMIDPIDDIRASKDFRAFMVQEFVERLFKKLQ